MINKKGILKIRVAKAKTVTFEVTERKATTRVGESELKRGFLTFFSHSKLCMRRSSHKASKL